MGRATEVIYLINLDNMPSKRDVQVLCPSLSEIDRERIKDMRKEIKAKRND